MYEFGNWLTRALRGGVTLYPAEQWLLAQLVSALPEHLKATVDAQLSSYNLAQREADGRAINLYRRPALLPQMPLLPMNTVEAPLVRLTVNAATDGPIHATLNAVSGRVFCMALSRSVRDVSPLSFGGTQITQAWRSNFPACAPNSSFRPKPLRGSA